MVLFDDEKLPCMESILDISSTPTPVYSTSSTLPKEPNLMSLAQLLPKLSYLCMLCIPTLTRIVAVRVSRKKHNMHKKGNSANNGISGVEFGSFHGEKVGFMEISTYYCGLYRPLNSVEWFHSKQKNHAVSQLF